jgi:hypothetical protein
VKAKSGRLSFVFEALETMMGKQLMLTVFITVGLSAAVQAASRHSWWVFDFENNACVLAAQRDPHTPTPEALHLSLRKEGLIDIIEVKRNNNGDIVMVEISTRFPADTHEVSAHFFLSEGRCRDFATAAGAPNPEDLR